MELQAPGLRTAQSACEYADSQAFPQILWIRIHGGCNIPCVGAGGQDDSLGGPTGLRVEFGFVVTAYHSERTKNKSSKGIRHMRVG